MGERGKRVVLDRYNWEHEAEKIINLYRSIA
jgi:glycosyltransferase involved in cell wall biosynthesis